MHFQLQNKEFHIFSNDVNTRSRDQRVEKSIENDQELLKIN